MSKTITILNPTISSIQSAMEQNGFPPSEAKGAAPTIASFCSRVDAINKSLANVGPLIRNRSRFLVQNSATAFYCEAAPHRIEGRAAVSLRFGRDKKRYWRKLGD